MKVLTNFVRSDVRFEILLKVGRLLNPRYRFHWPQVQWWDDAWFNDYLTRFDEIKGMNTHRRWTLGQLMRLVEHIPGDTAECGVYKGAGSYLMCQVNARASIYKRWHFGFDSFEGLSAPSAPDGKYWRKGDLAAGLSEAINNLRDCDACTLYSGWIPQRFLEVEDRRFAFVHIDLDIYKPTLESLSFFYPRTNDGGIIVCDDYGFHICPGATRAVDEFLADRSERMIVLPCGGGFLIKGLQTMGQMGL